MVFPEFQSAADQASLKAQASYLRFVKGQLILLFATTLCSMFFSTYFLLGYVIAFFMVLSIVLSLVLKFRKPEKLWYDGRAVAESLKTLSWRYSMRATPFDSTVSGIADKKFFESIIEVLKERRDVTSVPNQQSSITSKMRDIRLMSLQERLDLYIKQRIEDQCKWYSDKSTYNKDRETRYFFISLILQLLALAYIILMLAVPKVEFNLIAIISSLATITLTWLQTKQHRELAQAYTIAAFELGQIALLKPTITTEQELSEYVNESENAISREHTLWTARRGQ